MSIQYNQQQLDLNQQEDSAKNALLEIDSLSQIEDFQKHLSPMGKSPSLPISQQIKQTKQQQLQQDESLRNFISLKQTPNLKKYKKQLQTSEQRSTDKSNLEGWLENNNMHLPNLIIQSNNQIYKEYQQQNQSKTPKCTTNEKQKQSKKTRNVINLINAIKQKNNHNQQTQNDSKQKQYQIQQQQQKKIQELIDKQVTKHSINSKQQLEQQIIQILQNKLSKNPQLSEIINILNKDVDKEPQFKKKKQKFIQDLKQLLVQKQIKKNNYSSKQIDIQEQLIQQQQNIGLKLNGISINSQFSPVSQDLRYQSNYQKFFLKKSPTFQEDDVEEQYGNENYEQNNNIININKSQDDNFSYYNQLHLKQKKFLNQNQLICSAREPENNNNNQQQQQQQLFSQKKKDLPITQAEKSFYKLHKYTNYSNEKWPKLEPEKEMLKIKEHLKKEQFLQQELKASKTHIKNKNIYLQARKYKRTYPKAQSNDIPLMQQQQLQHKQQDSPKQINMSKSKTKNKHFKINLSIDTMSKSCKPIVKPILTSIHSQDSQKNNHNIINTHPTPYQKNSNNMIIDNFSNSDNYKGNNYDPLLDQHQFQYQQDIYNEYIPQHNNSEQILQNFQQQNQQPYFKSKKLKRQKSLQQQLYEQFQ